MAENPLTDPVVAAFKLLMRHEVVHRKGMSEIKVSRPLHDRLVDSMETISSEPLKFRGIPIICDEA